MRVPTTRARRPPRVSHRGLRLTLHSFYGGDISPYCRHSLWTRHRHVRVRTARKVQGIPRMVGACSASRVELCLLKSSAFGRSIQSRRLCGAHDGTRRRRSQRSSRHAVGVTEIGRPPPGGVEVLAAARLVAPIRDARRHKRWRTRPVPTTSHRRASSVVVHARRAAPGSRTRQPRRARSTGSIAPWHSDSHGNTFTFASSPPGTPHVKRAPGCPPWKNPVPPGFMNIGRIMAARKPIPA